MGLIIIVKRGLWITSVAARQNWIHKRSAGVAEYSVHGPGGGRGSIYLTDALSMYSLFLVSILHPRVDPLILLRCS